MSRVRVVIATTSGPVEVRRITPEHSDVDSAVCIEHTDSELPISAAYNSFVRPPTGIIQRHFEHDSYLLELSDRIDVGDSWKLGVFAAHAMFDLAILQSSVTARTGGAQWFAEAVATFGLVATILGTVRVRPDSVAYAVGLYITAGYWFTASTSFANPAASVTFSNLPPPRLRHSSLPPTWFTK